MTYLGFMIPVLPEAMIPMNGRRAAQNVSYNSYETRESLLNVMG
jgi:hypothetical protein